METYRSWHGFHKQHSPPYFQTALNLEAFRRDRGDLQTIRFGYHEMPQLRVGRQ